MSNLAKTAGTCTRETKPSQVDNATRRLPVEILQEIFIQMQVMLCGKSIVPTAQVCHHWREIAIATPELWNHFSIQYDIKRILANEDMTPIWLQRSGSQPLNITLKLGRPEPDPSLINYHPYSDGEYGTLDAMIIDHASRWKVLKLSGTVALRPFLLRIPESLPMLHSLHIDGDAYPGYSKALVTLDSFRNAPALRVFTLGWSVSFARPGIPWAQLTTCTIDHAAIYTCRDGYFILSQAVNLQSFTVTVDATVWRRSQPLPRAGIRHINLRSLNIEARGSRLLELFNLLTLPALTELDLVLYRADNPPECLEALLARSGCSLTRLRSELH